MWAITRSWRGTMPDLRTRALRAAYDIIADPGDATNQEERIIDATLALVNEGIDRAAREIGAGAADLNYTRLLSDSATAAGDVAAIIRREMGVGER